MVEPIHDATNAAIRVIQLPWIIASGSHLANFLGLQTEDEDVVVAYGFFDLDIRPVEGANRQRAVEGEFHVAGPRCLGPGGGDLLTEVGRRNDDFRERY